MSHKPADVQNHPVDFADAKAVGLYRAVCEHVVDVDKRELVGVPAEVLIAEGHGERVPG